MNEELNIIVLKLTDIGKELNRKFGTDSYELRCALFDIREELSKLSQYDVMLTFSDLQKGILKHKAKSEYQQASIIILRDIFKENAI